MRHPREFGCFVLKPYMTDRFDTGPFRSQLNEYIRTSMQWRDILTSKHLSLSIACSLVSTLC